MTTKYCIIKNQITFISAKKQNIRRERLGAGHEYEPILLFYNFCSFGVVHTCAIEMIAFVKLLQFKSFISEPYSQSVSSQP